MPYLENGTWFALKDPNDNETIFTYFSEFEYHSLAIVSVEVLALSLIFITGFFANLLVFCAVAFNNHLHSVTNFFIASLAFSDMLCAAGCPVIIVTRITTHWIMGSIMCKFNNYMQTLSAVNSVLTMVVISIDRYRCICKPHSHKLDRKVSLLCICILWIISIGITMPVWMSGVVKQIKTHGLEFQFCYVDWPPGLNAFVYLIALGCFLILIPAVIISTNYWRVIKVINSSAKKVNKDQANKVSRVQLRVIKMFVAIVIAFVVLWLPFFILTPLIIFVHGISSTHYTFTCIILLTNSTINPILYGYFNERFKGVFLRFFATCSRPFKDKNAVFPMIPIESVNKY